MIPGIVASCNLVVTYCYLTVEAVKQLPTAAKATEIFLQYSNFIRGGTLVASGAKELAVDGLHQRKHTRRHSYTRSMTPNRLALKVRKTQLHIFRGMLCLGAGILASWMAYQSTREHEVTAAYFLAKSAGHLLLLFANVAALQQNVLQYQEACSMIRKSTDQAEHERGVKTQKSAISGIVSSLASLFVAGCAVFGVSSTLVFVIGILATVTGFLKILYDYFFLSGNKAKTGSPLPPKRLIEQFEKAPE